jgi:hypothetical protein
VKSATLIELFVLALVSFSALTSRNRDLRPAQRAASFTITFRRGLHYPKVLVRYPELVAHFHELPFDCTPSFAFRGPRQALHPFFICFAIFFMSLDIQIMLAHDSLASNAFFAIIGMALKEQLTLVEFFPTLLGFQHCPC